MPTFSSDLTHADWWIRTTKKLLQKVDTSLRFTVVKVEKTQHLTIENISEATLSRLFFLVNTDQNNNYGYLEELQVFVKGDYSRTAIPIPGFSTLANAIWNEADATGFIEGQKTQTTFLAPLNNPYTNEPLTVPQYVDWITAVIPWAPKTFGKEKIFTLILNPDTEVGILGGEAVAREAEGSGGKTLLESLKDMLLSNPENERDSFAAVDEKGTAAENIMPTMAAAMYTPEQQQEISNFRLSTKIKTFLAVTLPPGIIVSTVEGLKNTNMNS